MSRITVADREAWEWEQKLYGVPEEQRSLRQQQLIASVETVRHAIAAIKRAFVGPTDLKSPAKLDALSALIRVDLLNHGRQAWRYFMSQDTLYQTQMYLTGVCTEILFEPGSNYCPEEPENLVPKMLAATVLSGSALLETTSATALENEDDDTLDRRSMHRLVEFFARPLLELDSSPGSSILLTCHEYLKEISFSFNTFDSCLDATSLVTLLRRNLKINACRKCSNSSPFAFHEFKSLVEGGKTMIRDVASGPMPCYTLNSFYSMEHYYRQLCLCYRASLSDHENQFSNNEDASDPSLEVEYWEAVNLHVNLLKRGLIDAKEAVPADPYSVVVVSDMLLKALLFGMSKTVSYTELEAICNDMKTALAACSAWAPPKWKLEMEADRKIAIDTVLPFLRNVNPSSYKTVSVDVYATSGFLSLYSNDIVDQAIRSLGNREIKKCAHCGRHRTDLFKCGGCESMWYCDKECQKRGWRRHKVSCREAQRRTNDSTA